MARIEIILLKFLALSFILVLFIYLLFLFPNIQCNLFYVYIKSETDSPETHDKEIKNSLPMKPVLFENINRREQQTMTDEFCKIPENEKQILNKVCK